MIHRLPKKSTAGPTVSTDDVAQDQIRAFVDRILRMKEEAKSVKDDIREIYAEAKGNGFDKTVLGKLVNYVEKRGKDSNAVAEADALFDIYLEAYDGSPSRTHAHAREEIPNVPVTDGGEAKSIRSSRTGHEEPTPNLKVPASDKKSEPGLGYNSAAADQGGEGVNSPALPADTVTDAPKPPPDDQEHRPAEAKTPDQEPNHNGSGGVHGLTGTHPATNVTTLVPKGRRWTYADAAHKDCLDPGQCGGFSNNGICQRCMEASAPHNGQVA